MNWWKLLAASRTAMAASMSGFGSPSAPVRSVKPIIATLRCWLVSLAVITARSPSRFREMTGDPAACGCGLTTSRTCRSNIEVEFDADQTLN